MGSPEVSFNPIAFIVDEPRAIQLPELEPSQYFQVLEAVVGKVRPHFRYLPWKTFREVLESQWKKSSGKMPDLPPGLTSKTKCKEIHADATWHKRARFILITRNGEMFLWHMEGIPEEISHRITVLTQEAFLLEWEMDSSYALVVWRVTQGLTAEFNGAANDIALRLRQFRGAESWLSLTNRRLPCKK